jgi:hypothetical protein
MQSILNAKQTLFLPEIICQKEVSASSEIVPARYPACVISCEACARWFALAAPDPQRILAAQGAAEQSLP